MLEDKVEIILHNTEQKEEMENRRENKIRKLP